MNTKGVLNIWNWQIMSLLKCQMNCLWNLQKMMMPSAV